MGSLIDILKPNFKNEMKVKHILFEASKTDEQLFNNAHDAIPCKIIGNVRHRGEIGLNFGDSPGSNPIVYFPGSSSGYFSPSDLEEVSHEDFFEFWGVDQDND